MEAHPDYEKILSGIEQCKADCVPLTGVVFRATSPRHFTAKALISGEGSSEHGGRWSPKGIRAVYGSFTPETAMAETLKRYRSAGIPIEKAMPKVFVGIKISISQSLDLTAIDVERVFGFSMSELLQEDWKLQQEGNVESRGQSIGRAVFALGIEALRVPSAADKGGQNIVVFPDVLQSGSAITAEGV